MPASLFVAGAVLRRSRKAKPSPDKERGGGEEKKCLVLEGMSPGDEKDKRGGADEIKPSKIATGS